MKILAILLVGLIQVSVAGEEVDPLLERDRKESFSGGGTEPFWSATFNNKTLTFREAGSEKDVVLAYDRIGTFAGFNEKLGWVYYQGEKPLAMVVAVETGDGMSDKVYPFQVTVFVGGGAYHGAGG